MLSSAARNVSRRDAHLFYLSHSTLNSAMDESNIVPFEPSKRSPVKPMKSSLVNEAAKIIQDPQILVNVVSKRVAQLNQGRAPLVETLPSMGAADIALTEIIEGKIVIATEKD